MDLERQAIEKRDFTSARKGYDPDEVDRHLRAIAEAVEALKTSAQPTVASVAAERVEAIVAAAEASARQIEESARAEAREVRERAEADAAVHVVHAEDIADQLTARAAELQKQMSDLIGQIAALTAGVTSLAGELGAPAAAPAPEGGFPLDPVPASTAEPEPEPEPVALQAVPDPEPEPAPPVPEGARLIALNMALSGTPREETARYLRENYDLTDQDALLDDVYARAGA